MEAHYLGFWQAIISQKAIISHVDWWTKQHAHKQWIWLILSHICYSTCLFLFFVHMQLHSWDCISLLLFAYPWDNRTFLYILFVFIYKYINKWLKFLLIFPLLFLWGCFIFLINLTIFYAWQVNGYVTFVRWVVGKSYPPACRFSFILVIIFLQCRSFLVGCNPTCLSLLLFACHWIINNISRFSVIRNSTQYNLLINLAVGTVVEYLRGNESLLSSYSCWTNCFLTYTM